jgi:carbon monoxide dehydrogenase subunit G
MELEHSFTVPVPEERAWEVLLDVERVAPCMPGASLDSVDGDAISGRIKVKVGPIAMTYAGTARFTERDENARVITLEAAGKETRGSGTASAKVRSMLEGQGEKTHVIVHTTLNVTGKPAQFGRGVMSEVSGKLIGIFAANLAEMLSAAPAQDAATGADSAAAEDATQSAAGDDTAAERAPAAAGDGAQSALALPLEELHLPLRSYNSLRRQGVHTVGELASRTAQDLLAMENIGRASVEEIRQKLAEHGLTLGEPAAAANGSGTASLAGPAADSVSAGQDTASQDTASQDTAASQGGNAAGRDAVAEAPSPGPTWAPPSRPSDHDAIDLLSVAGLPVLKRAIPVLAGLVAAVLVALGIRTRRRRHRARRK